MLLKSLTCCCEIDFFELSFYNYKMQSKFRFIENKIRSLRIKNPPIPSFVFFVLVLPFVYIWIQDWVFSTGILVKTLFYKYATGGETVSSCLQLHWSA